MPEIKDFSESAVIAFAREHGFSEAAFTDTAALTFVPEYRKYCEENLCGCYGRLPACPPESGTPDEMRARVLRYRRALVLQTLVPPEDSLHADTALAKVTHNRLAEKVRELIPFPHLWMSAGPYKDNSCMSAYCVDCQKLADSVGMLCWAHDGCYRFFSVICF